MQLAQSVSKTSPSFGWSQKTVLCVKLPRFKIFSKTPNYKVYLLQRKLYSLSGTNWHLGFLTTDIHSPLLVNVNEALIRLWRGNLNRDQERPKPDKKSETDGVEISQSSTSEISLLLERRKRTDFFRNFPFHFLARNFLHALLCRDITRRPLGLSFPFHLSPGQSDSGA